MVQAAAIAETVPKLVIRKIIHAKRERVFEAWTKPELLEQWLVPPDDWRARSKVDLRVGGRYSQDMIVGANADQSPQKDACRDGTYKPGEVLKHEGEYLEIKPPEKLVFTWNTQAVQNTRVTVELKDLGETTELWLTHELLLEEKQRAAHQGGWETCMAKLDAILQAK